MAHNNCQSVCYYFENKLFLNFITIFWSSFIVVENTRFA
jgi:hypothetical protein